MTLLFIIDNLQFFRDVFRSPILPKLLADETVEVIIATTYSPAAVTREFGHERLRVHAIKAGKPPLLSTLIYSLAKDVYTVERPDGSFTQKRLTEADQAERYSLQPRLAFARCLLALGVNSRSLTRWAAKFGGDPAFDAILAQEKPSLIAYSTMLPSPGEWLKCARRRGIPQVLCVASWDNPTSKGPLTVPPDYALVWSEEMKREMMRFHWLTPERVIPVGVLYFESYFTQTGLLNREQFCAALGIDPQCRILHYATGDSTLIKCNQEFIRVLQRMIASNQLGAPCHLLVRVSPKDVFSLYREFENLPHVTVQYPSGDGTLYGGHKWLPAAGEEKERASTIRNSDVILSVSSSMVLDACCFDIPVINLRYDAGMNVPPWESVERFFVYAHCQPALSENATFMVRSDAELLDALKTTLTDRSAKRTERQNLLKRMVGFTDGRTNERVVQHLLALARGRNSAVASASTAATETQTPVRTA